MAQYKISTVTNLFWAENDGFKSGRDPMGIQNSSVATYGCLLPGMTNLTGHIRYYSLYCWLLGEYDQIERQGNSQLHQYNFIRRAELIMAFIMKRQDVNSVVGADFAKYKYGAIQHNGIYDIAKGADYEEKEKYWAFRSGAFGQYYLGSLIFYNLVKIEYGRFYLRDKGKELAQATKDSVAKNTLSLMAKCVAEGRLSVPDITALRPLGLDNIAPGSPEWIYLNDLLTKQDTEGDGLRRETVHLMLKDLGSGITTSSFVSHRFLAYKKNKREGGAAFGWYFYYLCEALHYGIESIFCYVLYSIGKMGSPPVSVLLKSAVGALLQQLKDVQRYGSMDKWSQDCHGETDKQFSEIRRLVKDQKYAEAAAGALRLFMLLHQEYQNNKIAVLDFEQRHDLMRQRGILSEGLNDYVGRHIHLPLEAYLEKVLQQVMNEHTYVAIGKMGNNNLDLRKFIIENGCAILVEMRYPNGTSPRIESLHNFLVDLGYLTRDEKLTPTAKKFLSEYDKE